MAGQRIIINGTVGFIDYHDGEGSCVINGKQWRWEHHEYCGPMFLRKDGEPLKRQPGEKNPVWDEFSKWLKKYTKARKKAKSHQIVNV